MGSTFFYACGMLAAMSPFLAMIGILGFHFVRRSVLSWNQPKGKRVLGLWSSAVVLGTAFQFLEATYRPGVSHVLEIERDDRPDEDDSDNPDDPAKQLNRQLRKIRRGEPIDRIVVRLRDRRIEKTRL
jgi:hypothetical protein